MTLANRLTLLRAILVLPYAALLMSGETILAGIVFAIAAITDLLDGYVARKRQEETPLGRVLDPIADKMLTTTALIVLVANGTLWSFMLIPVLAIALRELWVAGLREGLVEQGGELPVSPLAKGKTTVQLVALFVLTFGPSVFGFALLWVAALLTFGTGVHYTVVTLKELSFGVQGPSSET
ncbi:MAG: CDP-diacylglycerol--glycerol-3-phosphate 3-phosphatidyltransferase [Pseudomonadota bacterium]